MVAPAWRASDHHHTQRGRLFFFTSEFGIHSLYYLLVYDYIYLSTMLMLRMHPP